MRVNKSVTRKNLILTLHNFRPLRDIDRRNARNHYKKSISRFFGGTANPRNHYVIFLNLGKPKRTIVILTRDSLTILYTYR